VFDNIDAKHLEDVTKVEIQAKRKRGKDSSVASPDRQAWWLDRVSNYG